MTQMQVARHVKLIRNITTDRYTSRRPEKYEFIAVIPLYYHYSDYGLRDEYQNKNPFSKVILFQHMGL